MARQDEWLPRDGESVDIVVEKAERPGTVTARVAHVAANGRIEVILPTRSPIGPFQEGQAVLIEYLREGGNVRARGDVERVWRSRANNRPVGLTIAPPAMEQQMFERRWVRVAVDAPIRYTLVEPVDPGVYHRRLCPVLRQAFGDQLDGEGVAGDVRDLGGGGVSFLAQQPLESGQHVYVEMMLAGEPLRALVRLVGQAVRRPGRLVRWVVRGEFLGLELSQNTKLFAYIFRAQAAQQRRWVER